MSEQLEGADLSEDRNAIARTGGQNEVLVRLSGDDQVFSEMSDYVRTDTYVKRKNSPGLAPNVKTILQSRQDDNQVRKKRVRDLLEAQLARADVFVKGAKLELKTSSAVEVLNKGLENLIVNTYSKLAYVRSPFESEREVESVLRDGSNLQTLEGEPPNAPAHAEVHGWLSEQERFNQRVTMRALTSRISAAPYGWAELDTAGVLAELIALGKAELRHPNGLDLRRPGIVKEMLSKSGLDNFTLHVPKVVDERALRLARELAREYFTDVATVPHDAQRVFELYQDKLGVRLRAHPELAERGQPGQLSLCSGVARTAERHQEALSWWRRGELFRHTEGERGRL